MLQDILPSRFDPTFAPCPPGPKSRVLWFCGGQLVARAQGGALAFPQLGQLPGLGPDKLTFLFRLDGEPFFLCFEPDPRCPAGFALTPASIFRRCPAAKAMAFAGMTGLHLANWYLANRYCGSCGGPMRQAQAERALCCPACGRLVYPRINPVVIVGVRDGDRLLLTRYAGRDYTRYALVAGFVEVGETPEDAARREVFEETGVHIKNLRYYASQPWAYSGSLLLGFFAELDGDGAITLQEEELSYACWTPRQEIEAEPDHFSLTNEMICRFKAGPVF